MDAQSLPHHKTRSRLRPERHDDVTSHQHVAGPALLAIAAVCVGASGAVVPGMVIVSSHPFGGPPAG